MKFSRLGLVVLVGVTAGVFTPFVWESSLLSVAPVVAQSNQERKEEADRLFKESYEPYKTGRFQQSLQLLQQALEIYQEINDRQSEAFSLGVIGLVYKSLYQYEKSIDYYQQSLLIYREINERKLVAIALNDLALVYYSLGQYKKAIDYHQQSLVITKEIGDNARLSNILNDIGNVYYALGKYEEAIDYHQRSLVIAQDIGNQENKAHALNNLGNVYFSLGKYEKAIAYYQQSLVIAQDIGDQEGKANSLNNLGVVYRSLGKYEEAIDYHQQSLVIQQEISNQEGTANALNNLGSVYFSLGNYEKAIDYYQRSLDIERKIINQAGIAGSFNNLGVVYRSLGQYEEAIDYHQQSLVITLDIGDQEGTANALNNLGSIYLSLGKYEKAINYYQQSLAITLDIGDQESTAANFNNLGTVYNSLGNYKKAIDYHQQSLVIQQEIGNQEGIASSLNNLGSALFMVSNFTAAKDYLTQAMKIRESLRVGLSDNQKISIFDTQTNTYGNLQLTLTAQNKTNQALEIAERGRARALVELLAKRFFSSSEDEKLPEYPQINEIKQIAQQQNSTLVQYSVIKNEIYIWVISPQGKIDFVSVDIPEETTLTDLVNQGLRCTVRHECRSDEIPKTFVPGDLVRFIDDKKSGLEEPWRVIGFDSQSGLLTVTHPQFNNTQLQRPKSDVIALVASPHIQKQKLQQLHKLLIAPIQKFLPEDENDHVIFIPHQELFSVPLPALQDAQGTYLIKQHTILTAPSIQALKLTKQRRNQLGEKDISQSEFLVVGNPEMPNNPEKPGENEKLEPLPHAETEAKVIATSFQTTAIIGSQATETTVVEKMKTADVIHLATHGLLGDYTGGSIPGAIALTPDPNNEQDGLLTADELFGLENQLQAQLVVLSACDTGKGEITGDGIIGLSRSLIAAGAPSIVVSLWKVDDASTGELMVRFYKHLETSGNKAQALRQAMLETMEERPFPQDWAAFTLIGEAE